MIFRAVTHRKHRPILAGFYFFLMALGSFLPLHAAGAEEIRLGLIGDSTVCNYPLSSPKRGWGQMLGEYLKPGVIIQNEAKGGMSSLSFPKENWDRILAAHPAFVFIQFGHNDSKKDQPELYTDPATTYRDHLRRYIRDARAAGIVPILVTSMHRRTFHQGILTTELAPYAEAAKAVGREDGVAVIDLYASSGELLQKLGEAGSENLTANKLLNPQAERPDRTHFTEAGARELAQLVVAQFPKIDERLARLVRESARSPVQQ